MTTAWPSWQTWPARRSMSCDLPVPLFPTMTQPRVIQSGSRRKSPPPLPPSVMILPILTFEACGEREVKCNGPLSRRRIGIRRPPAISFLQLEWAGAEKGNAQPYIPSPDLTSHEPRKRRSYGSPAQVQNNTTGTQTSFGSVFVQGTNSFVQIFGTRSGSLTKATSSATLSSSTTSSSSTT